MRASIESGHLTAETNRSKAVLNTEVTFLTVGTPEKANGTVDLRHVISASEDIGYALYPDRAVIGNMTSGRAKGWQIFLRISMARIFPCLG